MLERLLEKDMTVGTDINGAAAVMLAEAGNRDLGQDLLERPTVFEMPFNDTSLMQVRAKSGKRQKPDAIGGRGPGHPSPGLRGRRDENEGLPFEIDIDHFEAGKRRLLVHGQTIGFKMCRADLQLLANSR